MFIRDLPEPANIMSVSDLLEEDLFIPDYQRPYKWKEKNVSDLLDDIENAVNDHDKNSDFRYRIGTIILHKKKKGRKVTLNIVDGQQRIISLVLLRLFLDNDSDCNLLSRDFDHPISQINIYNNYHFIKGWFALKKGDNEYMQKVADAFYKTLQVVVICVDEEAEAFQLFDSQNSRGRALDPHDLLKAYHLREMKSFPYEMQHAVTKWEAVKTSHIRDLFKLYLVPIRQWIKCSKSFSFTDQDIDMFKGIAESSSYTYAKRAGKAMPHFQISEPFVAGNDFFEMVAHYLKLLNDISTEIESNSKLKIIHNILNDEKYVTTGFQSAKNLQNEKKHESAGFRYAKNLFYCAALCYYDRFRNFNEQAIIKLFSWAFMLRVDMRNLGFDSINNYAIGKSGCGYTNEEAMFSKISSARLHGEIANMQIKLKRESNSAESDKWNRLYRMIKTLNGF